MSEALKEASREPVSLESLIDGWAHLVQDIEKGYSLSIYDYTNDLSVRDILDSVIDKLPKELAVEVGKCLKEWDDRFLDATRSVQSPIMPTLPKGKGWRWFRVPKKLLGELREDLLSEGIIDPSWPPEAPARVGYFSQ